ncbi:SDR family oxidoreductase [bacterium]|nr:SDR family oxidoreductase [bacterium]
MKTVVITGSTRGIGFALAKSFLRRQCQVVISGHSDKSTDQAMAQLESQFSESHFTGCGCDVRNTAQLEALWDAAVSEFGQIDIWINNAGISNEQNPPWEIPPEEIQSVIETNMLGEIFGTRVAMRGFLEQGFGALYNVEGYGANGKMNNVMGLSIYGTSKAGLHFFNQCLAQEAEETGIITGALQPGMVLTDLITNRYLDRPDEWKRVSKIFAIIASRVEDVSEWMTDKILHNEKNGAYLNYSNPLRMLQRLLIPSKRTKVDFEPATPSA